MGKQTEGSLKLGKFNREEIFRHIKVYRPIKEEP